MNYTHKYFDNIEKKMDTILEELWYLIAKMSVKIKKYEERASKCKKCSKEEIHV